ncbi:MULTISPECIES: hypothetical protein [unclassified Methylophilus]|uniref:hypothetical protein n=1 Tax=unclassified Methylophilus TaxID=2630143 RepID=UPI000647418F|nr:MULTISPECIES: hypothetical protein [unclassified Methylophilus]
MSLKTLLIATALIIPACSSLPEKVNNPDKSKLGVLIVAGEGFNSSYSDPTGKNANATLLEASQKVSEYLKSEIQNEQHTEADQFVNLNSSVATRTFMAQQIAQKKRDGLIQVMIRHVKNTSENTIYLELAYNPLQYSASGNGEMLQIGKGMEERYTLAGPNLEGSNTPLNYFTHDFISKLSKAGYIGE